jgi:hypothetical protein
MERDWLSKSMDKTRQDGAAWIAVAEPNLSRERKRPPKLLHGQREKNVRENVNNEFSREVRRRGCAGARNCTVVVNIYELSVSDARARPVL